MSWCGGGEIRPTPGVEWRTARDVLVDLVAGQLAALAGLGALRHLDLDVVGVDQVFGGHAEAARGDLLDRRAHRIAVGQRLEAVGLLAALAGVRLAADAVHRDRQRGVRLAADRAEAHRAGGEALDDLGSPARPRRAASACRPACSSISPRMVSSRSLCSLIDCGERLVLRPGCCRAPRAAGWRRCSRRPGVVLAAQAEGVDRRRHRASCA